MLERLSKEGLRGDFGTMHYVLTISDGVGVSGTEKFS